MLSDLPTPLTRWGALALLASLPPLAACQQTCTGVGCEEQFAGALVGILPGEELSVASTLSPLDAPYALAGTKDLGPEADVALLAGAAWVGTGDDSAVRRYDLGAAGVSWPSDATAVLSDMEGDDGDDAFGSAVALLGDLDGDGLDELGVGAPLRDASDEHRDAGSIYVFSGLADPAASVPDGPWLRITGEIPSARLGSALVGCGDLDGDGRADFAASAPWDNTGASLAGSVFAALSGQLPVAGGTQLVGEAGVVLTGGIPGERLGNSLACNADVAGIDGGAPDGASDLLLGAPFADAADAEAAGVVYLVAGGGAWSSGPAAEAAVHTLTVSIDNGWLGWSVAAGDMDGDGLPEVASGAPGVLADGDALARGAVFLWSGADLAASASPTPRNRLDGEADGDAFGRAVSITDLDGDGLGDLAVGAPRHAPADSGSAFESGAVYLFFGTEGFDGWTTTRGAESADLRLESQQAYLRAGQQLRSGDLDEDGKADLVLVERFDPASGVPEEP